MAARAWVAVIEIQCMGTDAVCEGRFGSAGREAAAPNRGLRARPDFFHPASRHFSGGLTRAGQGNTERIDQSISRSDEDRIGNVINPGFDDEARQCAGDHPLSSSSKHRCPSASKSSLCRGRSSNAAEHAS